MTQTMTQTTSKKSASKKKKAPVVEQKNIQATPKIYLPSFHYERRDSSPRPLPQEFVSGIQDIEDDLGMRCLLFIQNGELPDGTPTSITYSCYRHFFDNRKKIPSGEPVAILIESAGGDPSSAY